jgi:hypothetical protein
MVSLPAEQPVALIENESQNKIGEKTLVKKGFGGRPPGAPNKATASARAAIGAFVDRNAERLDDLLDRIEETDGPKAAWDCIMSVVEYHVPKLARTELTGKDGAPITISAAPTDPKL